MTPGEDRAITFRIGSDDANISTDRLALEPLRRRHLMRQIRATLRPSLSVLLLLSHASQVHAACELTPEASDTIVRGRFVRCENASFHLDAAGAYERYAKDLDDAISRVGPQNRGALFERLGIPMTSDWPYDAFLDDRVAVVAVEWHTSIVPWIPGVSENVELKAEPREFRETIRYWWRGAAQACEAITEWSTVDLWVHAECCDTPSFGAPVCIVRMDYAEPAPAAMSAAIAAMLGQ